jgi:hypothetical protein
VSAGEIADDGMMRRFALVVCLVACKNGSSGTSVDAPAIGSDAAPSDAAHLMATKVIGSAGDTLDVDGATLTVPAGALTSDVAITITKTTDVGAFGGTPSVIYLLEPEGQTFAAPVTFTLHLAAPPGGGETVLWSKLGVSTPMASTDYELRPTTVTGSDVTAANTHFSHVYAARIAVAFQ